MFLTFLSALSLTSLVVEIPAVLHVFIGGITTSIPDELGLVVAMLKELFAELNTLQFEAFDQFAFTAPVQT